jgi:hypothetical protein
MKATKIHLRTNLTQEMKDIYDKSHRILMKPH